MEFLKRLCREEDGQGLVEYTFVVVLVALVFWMGIKDTAVGDTLAKKLGENFGLRGFAVFV